ncbi:Modification methylase DpnIIA [compost metagenome]
MLRSLHASNQGKASPFLKWAGGKGRLLAQYQPLFPQSFERYFEPFVGAGAVFFHLNPAEAHISDVNPELVNAYTIIRDQVDALIEILGGYQHDRDFYYALRAQDPNTLAPAERAARIIYLNKTCFNGLYRVNRRGQFNVPFGDYKNPRILDEAGLRAASAALQGVSVMHQGFDAVLAEAKSGDFVYFDPPYHPLSPTASFTSYAADDFGPEDQIRLAAVFRRLDAKGVKLMLSNSDTPFIRDLYEGFHIQQVWAPRAINRDATKRQGVAEVVVTNYAPSEVVVPAPLAASKR